MENLTGKQLGAYRIVAPLGEGGMAAVYKAYQAGMDRYVAVKILPQTLAKDPMFVGRFKQEAQLLAKLQHPHILPVFDFGEAEGYTYIVMPFVESGTLTDLLKGRPLPLDQVRSLGSQVGDALDYAHSMGLVHRDVKPSNVLVDKRGNCLLTDFGIARMVESSAKFTSTGGIVGTPAYMSPEQGRGEKVDARTDIYSLGIMLYEMSVGRVPFDAETPIAVVFKHISDPLPLPSQANPNFPDSLERVILKALAKDPAERFASAGDLAKALKAAIPEDGLPTSAQPTLGMPTVAAPARASTVPLATAPQVAPPASAAPVAAPAPAAPARKGPPVWVWAVGGLAVLVLCILAALGGLALRNATRTRSTATALAGTHATAPAGGGSGGGAATPVPNAAKLEILSAGLDKDQLSTVAAYSLKVRVTSKEEGILTFWLDHFKDPGCQQLDPDASGSTQPYFNTAHLSAGSDKLHTLALDGAPIDTGFLSPGARLTDATGGRVLAEDVSHHICFPAARTGNAPAAGNPPMPHIDGAAPPGEWSAAQLAGTLPHGAFYALNDADNLYLLVDVTGDTTEDPPLPQAPWGDYFNVAVDVDNNAQIDANSDLLYGLRGKDLTLQQFLGPNTFSGAGPTASKLGMGFGPTDGLATPHRFWELALSLKELQAAPGGTIHLGLTTYSQRPSIWDEVPMSYQGDFSKLLALTLGP